MSDDDSRWITQGIETWYKVEREILLQPKSNLPQIVVADSHCIYTSVSNSPNAGSLSWRTARHTETLDLPDGSRVPFGVISFAAPAHSGANGFFVMSLPSVWRSKGISSGLGLETLMTCVLIHEITHTLQFYFVNPEMERLSKQFQLTDDIGDDSLQDAYKANPEYVADFQKETDLLYQAAEEPDALRARKLAQEALADLRSRRAKWFRESTKQWAPIDDVFLTMEGLGQWAAYTWLISRDGPHIEAGKALAEIRRKRNRWTQEEGLAIFLVVNRFVPDWQQFAFSSHPELAEQLLARAARE